MVHITRKPVVAVLKETAQGERRVALVPADIGKLSQYDIVVEAGAGLNAGFIDDDYTTAGGRIATRAEAIAGADLVLSVRAPDFAGFVPGKVLISLGGRDAAVAEAAAKAQILHLGMERLPRITRAQSMDVLSSQASIAGYAAVLEGARYLDTLLPMMTTAAGIVRPARMIALGAGVAGLQALATARRLGAVTFGFDVREAAREQVESLGAEFVFPDVPDAKAEGTGGYAAAQSDDQQARLRRALTPSLSRTNLIITSAQIPGRAAPILIELFGLSYAQLPVLRFLILASAFQFAFLACSAVVLFIGDVRSYAVLQLAFLTLNAGLTMILDFVSPERLGLGYLAACAASAILAYSAQARSIGNLNADILARA